MSKRNRFLIAVFFAGTVVVTAPLLWRTLVRDYFDRDIFELQSVPERDVAVVYGAAVLRSGHLSTVLRDRMDMAIQLYQSGRVKKITVSGYSDGGEYDEPAAMAAYAIRQGIPEEAVILDHSGHRTYETCRQASANHSLEQVILVTQRYHLPRAIFTCRLLGLDVVGVAADKRLYRAAQWYELRETAATVVALWDVLRTRPRIAL